MTTSFSRRAALLILVVCPVLALAAELTAPTPLGEPATKVYRQTLPDGRIMYSDKPIKGAKIDDTITPDPAVKGWKSDSGKPPVVPPRSERTPIKKMAPIPTSVKRKNIDDVNANEMKAEMLLEDAKKRQQAGVEPLPGERTGTVSGKSRLNEAYNARQRALEQDVIDAETRLRKSREERDSLQNLR